MRKLDQQGTLFLPLIIAVVLLLGALGFGFWAYGGMQDYKNNSDAKSAQAVAAAVAAEDTKKDAAYAEAAKQPLNTYSGPSSYGSIVAKYPRTWSAYVAESDNGGANPVDGYFEPGFVPSVLGQQPYALRVQVLNSPYDSELRQYESFVSIGKAKVTPYRFPKQQGTLGVRIDGQVTPTQTGSLIMVPLRDKTLKVWTESDQFKSDFDKNVLPNFDFVP
jgi:hypothetical protein